MEHYEISGYTTAKNLAQQLRHSAIVALLTKSLAEEENADMLLNQIARSLMSVARMPEAMNTPSRNRAMKLKPQGRPGTRWPWFSFLLNCACHDNSLVLACP